MSSLVKKILNRLHQIVKLCRSRMVRPALHPTQLSRLAVSCSFEYERPNTNLPSLQNGEVNRSAHSQDHVLTQLCIHNQHNQFIAGTSPCAYIRQPYDESIRGLPLKHVYKHFWGIAIVVEILNNKCTVSFRIQCPRYSMIQIGQASYFATLSCRKKYMEHWWGTVIILFRATYVAIL